MKTHQEYATFFIRSYTTFELNSVQGSTRAVMSGSTIVARHDFLPFGEEISEGTGLRTMGQGFGAPDKIRQRYGMTERDDATGLDHTWWRKYENRAGRWTSADPYLGSMSTANPQSLNRYAYTQNDSVNFVDPSGLDDIDIGNAGDVTIPISFNSPISGSSIFGRVLSIPWTTVIAQIKATVSDRKLPPYLA